MTAGAPRDGLESQDFSPENESPREACANLAMHFRALELESRRVLGGGRGDNGHWMVTEKGFATWASRLERAVQRLDHQHGYYECVGRDQARATENRLQSNLDEVEGALRWLVNVGYGVGKAGGAPESGEFEAALESGKHALNYIERELGSSPSGAP